MKVFLLLVLVALLALIAVNRQRIYVRDPLATVYKDDVQQSGVQVFVSLSGDVLLWRDGEPGEYRTLLQAWNMMPGIPFRLTCLRWMACLTDADHASIIPLNWNGNSGKGKGRYDPNVSMTGGKVTYMDADGDTMRVELR